MKLRIVIYGSVLVLCIAAALVVGFNFGDIIAGDTSANKTVEDFASTNAVRLSKNAILLVKMDSGYGAIKLLKSGGRSAKVKWWYQDGLCSTAFSEDGMCGITKLVDKVKVVHGSAKNRIDNKGSVDVVKINETSVKWSAPDWFYYDTRYGMMLKNEADIKRVVISEHDDWTYIK
ncbi:MAG TPA: hypothetical protein VLX68_13225 [Chitinivibrionales bacterium]|nr:hypothetical protein [Chitinivibrionales bacterium]